MSECLSFEDIAAYIDGECQPDPATTAHHLASCAICAREAAQIRLVNMAVRANEMRISAPPSLTDWIDARQGRRGVWLSRRRAIGGLAVAASAAVAALILTRGGNNAMAMEPTLFRDYATLVAANGPLDFESGDAQQVFAWFRVRLPFALPHLSQVRSVGVRGARLCWLLERRVAALHLGHVGEGVCLYITTAEGLILKEGVALPSGGPPVMLSEGAMSGAFWRESQLALGLIGDRSKSQIRELAERLRGSG